MTTEISGRVIKGYELQEQLGAGGFGAVYRAYQQTIGREVAIKVILPALASQPEFVRRFETEARLVARLEHPYIVPLFDYWRDPDGAYLVMRMFRGGSLRTAIDEHKITPEVALKLVDQIGGALMIAHRNNVIHRDLKPDNILLDDDGNAFLTDFGIAKLSSKGSDDEEEEGISGSPGYMSPEQITGTDISNRTDIYSMGVIIFEMLTGTHPFPGQSTTELLISHLNEPIPSTFMANPSLPPEVNEVIQKATAKVPEDRYPDILALVNALRQALATESTPDIRFVTTDIELLTANPYKGLRSFEEADAADFFGREALIAQLLDRLKEPVPFSRFLAVVGPSGSGKSSVVKAGVLPALRWGELPGSEHWFIAEFVPGNTPLENLAAELNGVAVRPVDVYALLDTSPNPLQAFVQASLPPGSELLLVIDQFEEAFTQVESETTRLQFLNLIRSAITAPDSVVRVIVTLRADFYDRPLLYEGFGALMRSRTEVVLPLTAEELERAIVGPADRVGLLVDGGLLAAIIADVSEEPGALPLLEYVLTELYEWREGRTLTHSAYQSIGGALGALARRADELFQAMDPARQAVTRQLFLRLVTLGEGTEDTRRRVLRSELMSIGTDAAVLEDVLNQFGKYRLLSFDRDGQTREPTIEIAHEALIREWKLLREWLSTSRDDVRNQRNLAAAAADWLNAPTAARESFLLRDGRLSGVEAWLTTTDLALTRQEREFMAASIAHRQQLLAAEQERQQRERQLELQARRRLRALVILMTLGFIAALGLSLFAFNLREIAQNERNNVRTQVAIAATSAYEAQQQGEIARREAAISHSLALSASASQLESTGNHELALALIVAATELENPPDQSQRVLGELAYAPGLISQIGDSASGHTAPVTTVRFSPDGGMILSGSSDGSLILWDAVTRERLRVFSGHTLPVASAVFTADGQQILSGSWDTTLRLWDVSSGATLRELTGHRGVVRAVATLPGGSQAVSGSTDGVILWDLTTGEIIQRYETVGSVFSLVVSPDGTSLLTGTQDSNLVLLSLETGDLLQRFVGHTSAVLSAAFSPDGSRIVSSAGDNTLILWNTLTGSTLQRLEGGHSQPVNSVVFTPDGQHVLAASDDFTLIQWDLATGQPALRFGGSGGRGEHTDAVAAVDISPDGKAAITGGADQLLLLWSLTGDARLETYPTRPGSINAVGFVAGQRTFAAADDGQLVVYAQDTGELLNTFSATAGLLTAAVSADGDSLAVGQDDNTVLLWQPANRTDPLVLNGHTAPVTALVFSPDGTRLVSGAEDNTLIVWNVSDGTPLLTLGANGTGHSRRVLSVAYCPDNQTIISGSFDRTLIVWDGTTGEPRFTLTGHTRRVLSIACGPDSRTAVSGSDDTSLILWDLVTGTSLQRLGVSGDDSGQAIFSVAYSPDGHTILSGTEQGTLTLWDLDTGKATRQFQVDAADNAGPPTAVTALAFSPDGQTALSGLRDGRVILWQTPALTELIAWTRANRFIPEFTCDERIRYNITPLCEVATASPAVPADDGSAAVTPPPASTVTP